MKNFKRRFGLFSIMALCLGASLVCSSCREPITPGDPISMGSTYSDLPNGYEKVKNIGCFSGHRVDLVRQITNAQYATVCVDITVGDVYLGQLNDSTYNYYVYENFNETKGDFIHKSYEKGIISHDDLIEMAERLGVSQPTND